MPTTPIKLSPEEIARIGERFYLEELKNTLEKEHNGEFLVIDVEAKQYVINPDKYEALEEAKKRFGEKLFLIIQIGTLQRPETNYVNTQRYGWHF